MEKMQEQMEALMRTLDAAGVKYERHNPYVSFDNGSGECWVFPSQTHDGKLVVSYSRREWCETADEALRLCGVTG